MISSSQIRGQLAKFLDDQVSLEDFENWFVRNTWDIHLTGSVAAETITFAIEESLSEFSSRHISEMELRQELRQLIQRDNKVLTVYSVRRWYPTVSSDSAVLVGAQP